MLSKSRPLRVLILSHYFWPEPIPKPRELAEALQAEGHRVEVVTGFPNYPEGRLYAGYSLRLLRREEIAGVLVRRTYMHPDHGKGLVGRLLNYLSFMISGIVGGLTAAPFDVMYVWHPPLSVGVTAGVIGFLRRRPFVYDVQDIWPESAIASGFLRPGRIVRWMAVLERLVYGWAGHILVVTDGAKANLQGKGVPGEKITVVPHWYDDKDIQSIGPGARMEVRTREGWHDHFVVMFAGNLGMMQGLDTIIRACAAFPPKSNLLVVFVGDGSDRKRLEGLARELAVEDRVRFLGRVPSSAMGSYFVGADTLLVHVRSSALSSMIIPSKTVAYLAAGKPIVMANVGASADLIERSGAGIVVPPDDPDALATAIVDISTRAESELLRMAESGRRFFEENFTRRATLPKYIALLESAAKRDRAES